MIRRVANCASTCANHMSGSAGQKGGSFRAMALTAPAGASSVIVGVTNVDSTVHRSQRLGSTQPRIRITGNVITELRARDQKHTWLDMLDRKGLTVRVLLMCPLPQALPLTHMYMYAHARTHPQMGILCPTHVHVLHMHPHMIAFPCIYKYMHTNGIFCPKLTCTCTVEVKKLCPYRNRTTTVAVATPWKTTQNCVPAPYVITTYLGQPLRVAYLRYHL